MTKELEKAIDAMQWWSEKDDEQADKDNKGG